MASVNPESGLYKDLEHVLNQMENPSKYISENYTSKALLKAVEKWIENGVFGLKKIKEGSDASWVVDLCESLYFTFIYEGYKVNDYAEAVYLLGYASDINSARVNLLSDFCNGTATSEDISRYQQLFDLGIIAQIAALHAYAGLLSVYNRYDLKMEAEDQAALLSWNHDYDWYIKQCRKCLEADLAAGKAVKRTINNQTQPTNNNTTEGASKQSNVSASNVVSEASALVGKYPYVWGGKSPSDGGFDCSGLVYYVYHNRLGYDLTYQLVYSRSIPGEKIEKKSSLAAGDIIFGLNSSGGWHTGIFIGNNTMIHAGSSKGVSKTSINGKWFTFKFAIRPSNFKQDTSTPTVSTTSQKLQVASNQTGRWMVTVPANHNTIYLYSSATSTVKADQLSKKSYEYYITGVFQQAVLSDGTTRYCASFGTSNGSKDYWFVLTDRMSVEGFNSNDNQDNTHNTSSLSIVKSEKGLWDVAVPANYRVDYYPTAISTEIIDYTPASDNGFRNVNFCEKVLLSDGTTRLGGGSIWFTVTNEMRILDRNATYYTVMLDLNGGSSGPGPIEVNANSSYGPLSTPLHSNPDAVFDGWYSAAVGGIKVTSSSNLITNANHTLYAHWNNVG